MTYGSLRHDFSDNNTVCLQTELLDKSTEQWIPLEAYDNKELFDIYSLSFGTWKIETSIIIHSIDDPK